MYLLIDKGRMAVIYRCEKVETIRALANIEFSNVACSIFEETCKEAYGNNINELQDLFKGLTGGIDPHSHNRDYLVGQIVRLCQTAEPSNVDAFEATVQFMQINGRDTNCYRYIRGANRAELRQEPYCHPALLGNWKAAQALPLVTSQPSAPAPQQAPAQAQPWAVQPQTSPPKYAPPWA